MNPFSRSIIGGKT